MQRSLAAVLPGILGGFCEQLENNDVNGRLYRHGTRYKMPRNAAAPAEVIMTATVRKKRPPLSVSHGVPGEAQWDTCELDPPGTKRNMSALQRTPENAFWPQPIIDQEARMEIPLGDFSHDLS